MAGRHHTLLFDAHDRPRIDEKERSFPAEPNACLGGRRTGVGEVIEANPIEILHEPRDGGVITIMHTEVPKELNGKGIGSALVRGLLEIVRAQGLRVVALCPFVAGYIAKHPEYADFLR